LTKNILVIYYTQTGQLKQIVDSLLSPLAASSVFSIDYLEIRPAVAYPFPWTRNAFLDVFPESILEAPIGLKPVEAKYRGAYDLIILAFQPWYLSPSLPISAFLKSTDTAGLLKGHRVVTVIGARNMWVQSFERVKERVESLGGTLVGNIALTDRALNLVSAVTIGYWMFHGKKDRCLGVFPKPGISDADIAGAARFGKVLENALINDRTDRVGEELDKLGAAEINDSLARLEIRAKRIFKMWAKLIITRSKIRRLLLNMFFIELILGLVILSPLNSLLGIILKSFRNKTARA